MVLMDNKGEVIEKERISNQEIKEYLQEIVPQEIFAVLETTRRCSFLLAVRCWPTAK